MHGPMTSTTDRRGRTPLAAALDDISAPGSRYRDRGPRRSASVAAVDAAMDAALAVVEDANLADRTLVRPAVRRRLLAWLEQSFGPPPRVVTRARHPSDLHAALLDWHDDLLDSLMPSRATDQIVPTRRFCGDQPGPPV